MDDERFYLLRLMSWDDTYYTAVVETRDERELFDEPTLAAMRERGFRLEFSRLDTVASMTAFIKDRRFA